MDYFVSGDKIKYKDVEFIVLSAVASAEAQDVIYDLRQLARGGVFIQGITHSKLELGLVELIFNAKEQKDIFEKAQDIFEQKFSRTDENGEAFDEIVEALERAGNVVIENDTYANMIKVFRKKTINNIAMQVHANAVEHGWWETERDFGMILALIHSEISEALEEFRDGKPAHYMVDGKPEGIAVELVDAIIRIMDLFGQQEWDLEKILLQKHEYNKTRPYKHGGKKA